MQSPSVRRHEFASCVLASGTCAGLLSAAVLVWRGRVQRLGGPAAVNAPSQWVWGRRALRQDGASLRYTLTGLLIHQASSLFWAVFYEALQASRRGRSAGSAVVDAAAVTAAAAVVDLKLVPERLTPGFEKRLNRRSLVWVYASFAAGLAAASWCWRR